MTRSQRVSASRRRAIADEHRSWIRTIVVNAIAGMAIGAVLAMALIWMDVARIGQMIAASPDRFGFSVLLMFGFASLFGMLSAGSAIWMRAEMEQRNHG